MIAVIGEIDAHSNIVHSVYRSTERKAVEGACHLARISNLPQIITDLIAS